MYDGISRAIRASSRTTKRPGEMAELIENPAAGSDPSWAEKDSTRPEISSIPAKAPAKDENPRKHELLGISKDDRIRLLDNCQTV